MSDIPALAPFFFVEPDYNSVEAQKMRRSLSTEHYSESNWQLQPCHWLLTLCVDAVIDGLLPRLRSMLASWNPATLEGILHDENGKTSLKQKEYMTILRYALTGMKVCLASFEYIESRLIFTLCRQDQALLTYSMSLAQNAVSRGCRH